jgi:hypothetical protein
MIKVQLHNQFAVRSSQISALACATGPTGNPFIRQKKLLLEGFELLSCGWEFPASSAGLLAAMYFRRLCQCIMGGRVKLSKKGPVKFTGPDKYLPIFQIAPWGEGVLILLKICQIFEWANVGGK